MNTQIDNNHEYNVGLKPLFLADGRATDFCATVREDTGAPLATVSKRYEVFQNKQLIDAIEPAFRELGLDPTNRRVTLAKGGARFFARYDFREKTAEVPNVGDLVGLRITAKNSFDKSFPIVLECGLLRLVCTNGCARSGVDFRLNQAHVGTGLVLKNIRDTIGQCIAGFEDAVQSFGRFSLLSIDQKTGESVIETLSEQEIVSSRITEKIHQVWERPTYKEDAPRTLWSLYNAATQVLTHETEKDKYELAQDLNRKVSNLFTSFARDSSKLNDFLALAS